MAEAGKGTPANLGQQAIQTLAAGQARLRAMPAQRQRSLAAGAMVVLAVIAGVAWWANRPDWRTLYSGLDARDTGVVSQELGAAGVAFRIASDQNGIEVPAELLEKARMEIAAKGMPQSGRLGFELFDKPNWVGSEFDERVNYQRALEGELERTIASLGVVRSARVHLVLPAASLFAEDRKDAKASVVLRLRRATVDPDQAEAIRRLVAGAVDSLTPENVALLDADGRVSFSAKGVSARQGDQEQALEAKLVAMIEPMAGAGNVRAIVNAAYDEGTEIRTDEIYDPTSAVALTMQRSDQTSAGSGAKASGVPGTASNSPAAAPAGAVEGSAAAAAPGTPPLLQAGAKDAKAGGKEVLPVYPDRSGGQGQTTRQENGTYAVNKHTVKREDAPGRLRRVTVAVLVNDRQLATGAWKPRTPDEMHRLEGLAQAAVGFDLKRGDLVTVENVSFTSNAVESKPQGIDKVVDQAKGLVSAQPAITRASVTAVLGVLVILFVLRPISKQMIATLREPIALANPGHSRHALHHEPAAALAAGPGKEQMETLDAVVVEQVAEYIRKKPTQSARLLENWIDGSQEAS